MSAPATHPKAAAPESSTAAAAPGKVRILVVDDEPSMREMLRIVLRRDGYEVLVAENGRDAIEQLRATSVDLLLSDIKMPDITGVDVLRAAKEINRDVVAFMMTAFASTSTAVEAMRLGAVDYFTKPFSMDELRRRMPELRRRAPSSRRRPPSPACRTSRGSPSCGADRRSIPRS